MHACDLCVCVCSCTRAQNWRRAANTCPSPPRARCFLIWTRRSGRAGKEGTRKPGSEGTHKPGLKGTGVGVTRVQRRPMSWRTARCCRCSTRQPQCSGVCCACLRGRLLSQAADFSRPPSCKPRAWLWEMRPPSSRQGVGRRAKGLTKGSTKGLLCVSCTHAQRGTRSASQSTRCATLQHRGRACALCVSLWPNLTCHTQRGKRRGRCRLTSATACWCAVRCAGSPNSACACAVARVLSAAICALCADWPLHRISSDSGGSRVRVRRREGQRLSVAARWVRVWSSREKAGRVR
mmetsp:Transcript_22296/g.52864  ORF Transcript_22296/g.52864 Transcript_22296/m.52864 type:complete len:293 (+) Transcript_22296:468-1346(+)